MALIKQKQQVKYTITTSDAYKSATFLRISL